jgi:hypothetical protein
MMLTDFMFVGEDTFYFIVKCNHILLVSLLSLADASFEVIRLNNEKIVELLSNLVPFPEVQKNFCTNHVNLCTFHMLYIFYKKSMREIALQIAHPQPQTTTEPIMDVDDLIRQWVDVDASSDPIDALLTEFEFELEFLNMDIDDKDDVDIDTTISSWAEANTFIDPMDDLLFETSETSETSGVLGA